MADTLSIPLNQLTNQIGSRVVNEKGKTTQPLNLKAAVSVNLGGVQGVDTKGLLHIEVSTASKPLRDVYIGSSSTTEAATTPEFTIESEQDINIGGSQGIGTTPGSKKDLVNIAPGGQNKDIFIGSQFVRDKGTSTTNYTLTSTSGSINIGGVQGDKQESEVYIGSDSVERNAETKVTEAKAEKQTKSRFRFFRRK